MQVIAIFFEFASNVYQLYFSFMQFIKFIKNLISGFHLQILFYSFKKIYQLLMKFLLYLLMFLLISHIASRPYDTSINYVSNSDFDIPNQGTGWAIVISAGAWSEINNQIQIGNVHNYNSRWVSGQLCELDANQNSNIYQIINIDQGYYQLNINWAARQNRPLATSRWSVYWNDNFIKSITPSDYNIHTEVIQLKAKQGNNKLSLRGQGASDGYGAGINRVKLFGQNYIINGGFQIPDVLGSWKIFAFADKWRSYTDEIQIGRGTIYNSLWKTGQITELDAKNNAQIYQKVMLPAGKYYLKFDWAARNSIPLNSNSFSVFWNGDRIALIKPLDYLLHRYNSNIVVVCQSQNILTLRGEGISDGNGVGIDNVRLWTNI